MIIWTDSPKKQAIEQIRQPLNLALEASEHWCDRNKMKVNLDKTVTVSFSLTHQPLRIDFSYGGHAIPEADTFTHLGVTFDLKLSWRAHAENIVNRFSHRMAFLKHLADSKWGCPNATLNLTYRLSIFAILIYY